MFPIQFIFLLIVVSAPLQVDLITGSAPSLPMAVPVWALFASFFATQLLLVLFVWRRTRKAIRALHETSIGASKITHGADQLFHWARWAAVALTGFHLFCTPLAKMVLAHTEHAHVIQYIPALAETLFIMPGVIAWLGIWTASYHMEMASHERSFPYRLARGEPVHDMPTLGEFLAMQSRHNFFPYVLILLVGVFDKVGKYFEQHQYPAAPDVASVASLAAVFLLLPSILVRIWQTDPLHGPLRQRLDDVAARHRLRFRNILLWRTHNLVLNAAILGWLPFGRYFLMSDSLMESCTDRQLEAVFAHEVGHGVHRHIPWFLMIFLAAAAFWMGVGNLAVHISLPGVSGDMMAVTLSSLALLLIGGGAFYFVAPRFEHQADWFAARHMSKAMQDDASRAVMPAIMAPISPLPAELNWTLSTAPSPAETLSVEQYLAGQYSHAAGIAPVIQRATPAAAIAAAPASLSSATAAQQGAEVFISALDLLVEMLHRDRTRRDIMHPSVDDRVALLRSLTTDPAAEERFNRTMRRTRMVIVLLLAAGIATAGVSALVGGEKPPAGTPTTNVGKH